MDAVTRLASLLADPRRYRIWSKGHIVPGSEPDEWRRDDHGNLIRWSDYGDRRSRFGWEYDHIVPRALGGWDRIDNQRPMQWLANTRRPNLRSAMTRALAGLS